jgi:hypothetical protein
MAWLVPAIYVFISGNQDVDARDIGVRQNAVRSLNGYTRA